VARLRFKMGNIWEGGKAGHCGGPRGEDGCKGTDRAKECGCKSGRGGAWLLWRAFRQVLMGGGELICTGLSWARLPRKRVGAS